MTQPAHAALVSIKQRTGPVPVPIQTREPVTVSGPATFERAACPLFSGETGIR